ncbi:hypothetical protein [Pseudoruegeria sp. HB172150]|uniref:hypothetical protein n=1 Tax=Pseudoruegeria sp. HB172150 TaxID=2721164 RepID=UPI0015538662|nr:hypothetical protein [Pseudoruegeria sp. HB172150]
MHKTGLALAALVLAGCAQDLPDSNPDVGVGFGDYENYGTSRSTPAPAETNIIPRAAISDETPASARPKPPMVPPSAVATTTLPPAPTANPTPAVATTHAGISDEQDFEAVAERESIESDAARLKAQREAFIEVEPSAVPTRSGDSGNVVAFALATSNPVGTKVYSRNNLFADSKYQRNCAKYASSDLAQEDFLKQGGPERDRLGLDPDGDGFACSWDPTPFRRIAG